MKEHAYVTNKIPETIILFIIVSLSFIFAGFMVVPLRAGETNSEQEGEYIVSVAWKDDGVTEAFITIERTDDDDYFEFVKCSITSEVKTAATCESTGLAEYTARATFNSTEYAFTKEAELPATGHDYEEPEFIWAEDGKTAVARATCRNDSSHTLESICIVTSEVKTAPTCEDMGTTIYTAKVTLGGAEYSCGKEIMDIPATGHDYEEPEFIWAEDGKTAVARAVCRNDSSHTLEGICKVTSEVKVLPTYEEMGISTYTAVVTINGEEYTDTKDVRDIQKKEKIAVDIPAPDNTLFVYNGCEQEYNITPDDNYTVSGNKMTDAGTCTVTVSLKDKEKCIWSDGSSGDKTYCFTIARATMDMSGVTFESIKVVEDGKKHYILVSNLPSGVRAVYTGNGVKDTGVHTVTARFILSNDNYNDVPDMTATIEIAEAEKGTGCSAASTGLFYYLTVVLILPVLLLVKRKKEQ